ncbi:hypothetical protein [Cognaticolwellia mytili]|nr:hypothetical protein [Cognaticolwellia mytili]
MSDEILSKNVAQTFDIQSSILLAGEKYRESKFSIKPRHNLAIS